MNLRKGIRQAHRWLSITFTVLVLINVALNLVSLPEQVVLSVAVITLLPLALLMLTGLYLFALPYTTRRRTRTRTVE